jgi:hypothetical protein
MLRMSNRFRYLGALKQAFSGGGSISNLRNLDSMGMYIAASHPLIPSLIEERVGWLPSSQANVFVANHDSERVSFSRFIIVYSN